MEKDFGRWNEVQKRVESNEKKFPFREGEIWWLSIGINIGREICGKGPNSRRPVLVLRKLSGDSFIGLPITSKQKSGSWFANIYVKGESRCVVLNQIRMFSSKRFSSPVAELSEGELKKVKEKLQALLKLS